MARSLYPVCRARHARSDGEGARLAGGRWNSPGRAVVYMAESVALAVLENLVHMSAQDFHYRLRLGCGRSPRQPDHRDRAGSPSSGRSAGTEVPRPRRLVDRFQKVSRARSAIRGRNRRAYLSAQPGTSGLRADRCRPAGAVSLRSPPVSPGLTLTVLVDTGTGCQVQHSHSTRRSAG